MRNFKSSHSEVSPAEIFYRRNIRGRLPALPRPVEYEKVIAQKDLQLQERLADMAARAIPSPELEPGTPVVIQDAVTKEWRRKAVVIGRRDNGQSYWLADKFGDRFVRSRSFLKIDTPLMQLGSRQPSLSYRPSTKPHMPFDDSHAGAQSSRLATTPSPAQKIAGSPPANASTEGCPAYNTRSRRPCARAPCPTE